MSETPTAVQRARDLGALSAKSGNFIKPLPSRIRDLSGRGARGDG